MHSIIKIIGVEEWTRNEKPHSRTHVLLDNGEEAVGYGEDFKIGDECEVFFDPHHNTIKVIKK